MFGKRQPPRERRRCVRYPSARFPIVLGWYDSDRFRTATATLIDLSQNGLAAVVSAAVPPDRSEVWLHFGSASDWYEGRVIKVKRKRLVRKSWVVRVKLDENCPYELFRAAVPGINLNASAPGDPEEYGEFRW